MTLEELASKYAKEFWQRTSGYPMRSEVETLLRDFGAEFGQACAWKMVPGELTDEKTEAVRNAVKRAAGGEP